MKRRGFLASAAAAGLSAKTRLLPAAGNSERKFRKDPDTGVEVCQITSFPAVHENLYFHSRSWTADGRTFLFQGMSSASRDAGRDLFRCDIDGMGLVRLTHDQPWSNIALHPIKPLAYFIAGTNEVFTLDINTRKIETAGRIEGRGSAGGHPGSFTDDGRLYCFVWTSEDSTSGYGIFDTEKAEAQLVPLGVKGKFTHLQIEPGRGKEVQFVGDNEQGRITVYVADLKGRVEATPFTEANGHNAWLGSTGLVYTATLGEQRDILACRPGDQNARVTAKAPPRFWHPGASPEGDWLVSDTQTPDDGLHLICVKTGRHELLCRAGSSQGHSQYTHPHPSVGPGARHVLFNSDRTGIPHVYLAEIPEGMKRRLSS